MSRAAKLLKAIRDRSKRGRELVALYARESRAGQWRGARTVRLERKAKRTGNPRDVRRARESRAKLDTQRKKLERTKRQVRLSRIKLRHWKALYGRQRPQVRGNKVTGGTPRQRLMAAAHASARASANGSRHSYYSQQGDFDADHCITGERRPHRSDCSSWFASVYKSAGLPDPSGQDFRAGFTGTLLSHGRPCSRAQLAPGDAVIYGDGNGHHVEMFTGPGSLTIGHGSAPVDAGHIDMMGGTKRYRKYV